jgi:hypothetical protein
VGLDKLKKKIRPLIHVASDLTPIFNNVNVLPVHVTSYLRWMFPFIVLFMYALRVEINQVLDNL